MRLKGKTGIITGASSGIGAAAARLFVEEGARLVINARRETRLEALAEELGGRQTVEFVAGDVASAETHEALVRTAESAFGGLDFAFNNAGTVGNGSPLTEQSEADWHHVINTNLTSAYLAARCQIPAMLKRETSSLVFISSFVGHTIGLPGMAVYAASKAGLIGMAQVLAAENGAKGLRVNALLPGGTMTEMAGDDAAFHEYVKGIHALKRMAEPEEVARAALFLVGDDSSFVTGTAMLVDGGNSIFKP